MQNKDLQFSANITKYFKEITQIEELYNACEETAKQEGGMLLDKFYDVSLNYGFSIDDIIIRQIKKLPRFYF